MSRRMSIAAVALLLAVAPACPAAEPMRPRVPEFVEMLGSILAHGSDMGPYSGWFHPSEGRYGWAWLAARYDRDKDGAIEAEEWKGKGPAMLFRALDRDGDGSVTADDLDWSPRSAYLQSRARSRGRFARMDANGNGRVSAEEWSKVFGLAAKGKAYLTPDDLADLFEPAPMRRPKGGESAGGPSRWTLLKGLFSGEIGSATEGPRVGDEAPGFTLTTPDKAQRISLADSRGKRPVVLIFGSFT